jgi:hypothetical protein
MYLFQTCAQHQNICKTLILEHLSDLATRGGVDLTGTNQHGIKKRNTVTAALTIQSLVGRALNNKYYLLASLDLSLAFDVVDRPLFYKIMETMGIPESVRTLLDDWLTDQINYVKSNGSNYAFYSSNHGTVQGSVLGAVLFSLFIRLYNELEELATYPDDNYIREENGNLKVELDKLKAKTD